MRYAHEPAWKDLVLFYEFFHGDNGRGCGASHQTGWTSLVTKCLEDIATNHSRKISEALMPRKHALAVHSHRGTIAPGLDR
jgi:hypothetical protein